MGIFLKKMTRIFQHYDVSTQLTPVNTSNNSLVHTEDKRNKAVKVMLCMKFAATQSMLVMIHILVKLLNHHSIVLDNTVELATMKMIQQL